jgi:biofilm protein TabA
MILGNIANWELDEKALVAPLAKGLTYLRETDFSKLPDGRHEIEGPGMVAIVQEYQSAPPEGCEAETHRKYIDIQYICRGTEVVGYGLTGPGNEIRDAYSGETDAVIYSKVEQEMTFVLTAGMYAVFFPTDIHRPCCQYERPEQVKKVVLKIAVDSL